MIDLYKLLGIKRGATKDEVRKAYRRKAKRSHPDRGGSAEQFSALALAHEVLSDESRREKYDESGEIEPSRPDNADVSAMEVIAQKLGVMLHAAEDVASLNVDMLIEQAIRDDIARRKANIAEQRRAIERAGRLRARVKRKQEGDNALARMLVWHELAAADIIKKNEESLRSMQRALAILENYSFAVEAPAEPDDISSALHETMQALDDLMVILKSEPKAAAL